MIELIDLNAQNVNKSIDSVSNAVQHSVTAQLIRKGRQSEKFLLIYTLATVICYLFDGI